MSLLKLHNIKACIFDLDGTLLDSMHIWQEVDRKYLASYGIQFDPSFSEEIKTMTFNESAKYFKEKFHIPKSEEEIKADWYEMVEEEYRDHIQAKEKAIELVHQLAKEGMLLCVATSCNRKHATMALNRLGIHSCFTFIKTCLEIGKNKEFPDIYLACAKELQVEPNQCLVFEDLYMALKVAKDAGFKTVGVHDCLSVHEKEKMQQVCDCYIHSFAEIL